MSADQSSEKPKHNAVVLYRTFRYINRHPYYRSGKPVTCAAAAGYHLIKTRNLIVYYYCCKDERLVAKQKEREDKHAG